MRIVGIILVALGALALGWQGFSYVKKDRGADDGAHVAQDQEHPPVPPVVGGIAVVSGLILLASTNRRDDG